MAQWVSRPLEPRSTPRSSSTPLSLKVRDGQVTDALARLLGAKYADAVNVRFHRYRTRDFAVGGVLLIQGSPLPPESALLAR